MRGRLDYDADVPLLITGPGELFYSRFAIGSKHGWGLSQNEKHILLNILLMGT